MIGYATIGSNDLEKAKTFYDTVLVPLGGKRAFASDRMQGYAGAAGAMLAVCTPVRRRQGGSRQRQHGRAAGAVARGDRRDLQAGAGQRRHRRRRPPASAGPGFYGAYFRDLDGNKVCVFKMG